MALPLPRGLTPSETAFLCEDTLVTIVPRQKLDAVQLIGGSTPALAPSKRADVPLWFALLLKRQRRANLIAPSWLNPQSLQDILEVEKSAPEFIQPPDMPQSNNDTFSSSQSLPFSEPFLPTSTAHDAEGNTEEGSNLPYHWLEISHILLREAADDVPSAAQITRLIRDLREVRMAKLRAGVSVLDGSRAIGMNGVGGMEVAEGRAFVGGVIDGLRIIGASREDERKEREDEEAEEDDEDEGDEDEDDDMA